MFYFDPEQENHIELLKRENIAPARFQEVLKVVSIANMKFYSSNSANLHLHKMLNASQKDLENYPTFLKMNPKKKQAWKFIKNVKTGDRAHVNLHLVAFLKATYPKIYTQLLEPHFPDEDEWGQYQPFDLSDEIDTLLLLQNLPFYFHFLHWLFTYMEGVFNSLRRSYIRFLLSKLLSTIAAFLKNFEGNLPIIKVAMLESNHQKSWVEIAELLKRICLRTNPDHHDPLGRDDINCLRSIYVSLFNISMEWLQSEGNVPQDFKTILSIVPDAIDFSKNRLEYDNAWNRYQEHNFLFMRLSQQKKERMEKTLRSLNPAQRISWMGCLGKQEIENMILPMLSQNSRFESLTKTCASIKEEDQENYPYAIRVLEVLYGIYLKYVKDKRPSSLELAPLFEPVRERFSDISREEESQPTISSKLSDEEKDAIDSLQQLSFLVVDDSEKIRKITNHVLRDMGIKQIFEASTGEEAWEFLNQCIVNVVLCDWIMPGISGINLLRMIMKEESLASNLVFLMVTTVDDKASIVEAISEGARGYLMKPFNRKQLLEKVLFASEWLQRERDEKDSRIKKRSNQ